MICVKSFHFCLMDRLMILWYFIFALYWETSGRSLDQEGVYVTSRSGALRTLILWGHLLTSDLGLFDVGPYILTMMWLTDVMMRYYSYRQVLLTRLIECAGFWSWGCGGIGRPPWTPDWVRECAFGLIRLLWWLIWYDDLMMTFWHDYLWCRLTIACRIDSHME